MQRTGKACCPEFVCHASPLVPEDAIVFETIETGIVVTSGIEDDLKQELNRNVIPDKIKSSDISILYFIQRNMYY